MSAYAGTGLSKVNNLSPDIGVAVQGIQVGSCMTLETMAPVSDNAIIVLSAVPGT